jgi:pyruvate/2-oxoglutarate dehydrogenase complex dihydrolipoamide acyltransferase (E2) component
MAHLALKEKKDLSSFRRIAIGTWRTAYDPTVYGSCTLRMDQALRYLNDFREHHERKLTLTHMMAKAVAAVMEEMPDANAIMRFNRIYLRDSIGVFFQVAMKDPQTGELDLSGTTITDANEKSLVEIFDQFQKQVQTVRSGEDEELEGTRSLFKKIPYLLLNTFLKALGFFLFTLNLDLRKFGVPRDPFGSVMVTNVGSMGIEEAYVPLVPYARVPLLIAMGAVQDTPVAQDGQVEVQKTMRVFATFDHRILDGSHAAKMVATLQRWFEDPYTHFDKMNAPKEESVQIKSKQEAVSPT